MREDEDLFDGSLAIESEILQGLEPQLVDEENRSEPDVVNCMRRVRRAVKRALKETGDVGLTRNIVSEAIKESLNGQKGTEIMLENTQRDVMPKSKNLSVVSSSPQESSTDLSTDSSKPISILEKDASDSGNLMLSTSKRLENLLGALTDKYEKSEQEPSPEIVHAAASIAKQMTNIMRLGLDMMRFKKELFHAKENIKRLKNKGGGKIK